MTTMENPQKVVKVRSTRDNQRLRPNAWERHAPFKNDNSIENDLLLISSTDLEWLSINYRKVKASKLSNSKRRIILVMF